MAQQFWFVMKENLPLDETEVRGRYVPLRGSGADFGIFFKENNAEAFAAKLSSQNPGIEVMIGTAYAGFHSPLPPKATKKVWVNGEYILPEQAQTKAIV